MDRYRLLVLLQNAWSPVYAGGNWPRRSWLRALWRSRSGQRLRLIVDPLADFIETHLDNTTPRVGRTASTTLPADPKHVAAVIDAYAPDGVLTCGVQALAAVAPLWTGELLAVPHPASRLLTDALYKRAAAMLREGDFGRVALLVDRDRRSGMLRSLEA
jgi:hypothetical protein